MENEIDLELEKVAKLVFFRPPLCVPSFTLRKNSKFLNSLKSGLYGLVESKEGIWLK